MITHPVSAPTPELRDHPRLGWVGILMCVSASGWQCGHMTMTGGAAAALSAVFLPSHLPIVIGTSSEFPLLGGVQRVSYASVMLDLLVTARSTRLAVDGARNTSDAVLGDPTDIGRVA